MAVDLVVWLWCKGTKYKEGGGLMMQEGEGRWE